MRRYLIVSIVILMALAVAWPVLGQREGRESRQALSEEQRTRLRERWQNMSEEERQQLRNQMRERTASRGIVFGREEQLKVIEGIEEQLAKLKEAIKQAPDREELRKLPEASPEARAKLREEWQKTRQEQQQMVSAIQRQLTRLVGPRPPERIERPGLFLNELKAIRETAVKENAKKTVEHIESLITRYQIGQEEQVIKLKKAPEFTLTSFDGKTVSLSDYEGKIVALEWFNLECPFVQYHYNTATTMVDLAKKHKGKIVWLAINSTSHTTPEANKTFAEKHKLPYLILDDRSGKVGRAYKATNTPHIFIIDTKGYIAYDGAIDNSPMGETPQGQEPINYVDKALTELKAGRTVSIRETKPYGCTVKYAN
jgi:peroxiredoxin